MTPEERIEGLIEASSLGTPDAVAMRERTTPEQARRIVERAKKIAAEERPSWMSDYGADMRRVVAGARVRVANCDGSDALATVQRMDTPRFGVVRLDDGELALFHAANVMEIVVEATDDNP